MGQQRGSRVFVGVVLGVVAALGVIQPGASAEPTAEPTTEATSVRSDGAAPQFYPEYPTVCPAPTSGSGTDLLPQDPCEPPDPCAYDSDGDGVSDCYDPCPSDPNDTCDDPPPTTTPPTTQPPTTQPPTTQPPTTQPPVAPSPTSTPTPTVAPAPQPGCQSSCAYARQVDLRVTATKLKGAVDSVAQGCRADATVTLWRKKKGADHRLVVLTSKQTGAFRTARPVRAGRYYVTVASPEQPLCGSATSATVRVRRS